jgi:hypothetical protein
MCIILLTCLLNQIEVKAVPIDKKEIGDSDQGRKMRRVSQPDALTFGGHAQPSLDTPYEVTVKDKMCYYAITIMKVCLSGLIVVHTIKVPWSCEWNARHNQYHKDS